MASSLAGTVNYILLYSMLYVYGLTSLNVRIFRMRLTESTEKSDHQQKKVVYVGCGLCPHPTYTAHFLELGLLFSAAIYGFKTIHVG